MAENSKISQIKLPNGSTYDIVDNTSGYSKVHIVTYTSNYDEELEQDYLTFDATYTEVSNWLSNGELVVLDSRSTGRSYYPSGSDRGTLIFSNADGESIIFKSNNTGSYRESPFLTSFNLSEYETDPIFIASAAHGITSTDITNWNNKLDSYTETDPTVPSWAKQSSKPTYTASEVGAVAKSGDTMTGNLNLERHYLKFKNDADVTSTNTINIYSTTFRNAYNETIGQLYVSQRIASIDAPVTDAHLTNKKYVDDSINAISIPTKVSDLTNDSGFLTSESDPVFVASVAHDITSTDIINWNNKLDSYTETDPTVPAWAKAANKPSYTFSEIGSTPTTLSGYGITNAYTKTEIDGLVAGVLHYKGTKASVANLPTTGNVTGDVWHITADGSEYAWDGTIWQELGTAVDLSSYVTTDDSRLSDARTPLAHNQALSTITGAEDLQAIEALSGTSGFLKKTAANTWTLDTNTYLTSYTETDPVFLASAAYGISSSDISNWNAKSNTDEKLKTGVISTNKIYYLVLDGDANSATTKHRSNALFVEQVQNTLTLQIGKTGTIATKGELILVGTGNGTVTFDTNATTNQTITLPNATGTVALTSDIPTVPTNISAFTNDSGYLTSYTETDPVFSASAAAGITSTDISNWNAKVSDDKTWNNKSLSMSTTTGNNFYVPRFNSTSADTAYLTLFTATPTASCGVRYDGSAYIYSTTPSANDNSTKVATTAYVDAAIPVIPTYKIGYSDNSIGSALVGTAITEEPNYTPSGDIALETENVEVVTNASVINWTFDGVKLTILGVLAQKGTISTLKGATFNGNSVTFKIEEVEE